MKQLWNYQFTGYIKNATTFSLKKHYKTLWLFDYFLYYKNRPGRWAVGIEFG